MLCRLVGHGAMITSLAVVSGLVLSSSFDGTVRIWDILGPAGWSHAQGAGALHVLDSGKGEAVTALAATVDSGSSSLDLIAGCADGTCRAWSYDLTGNGQLEGTRAALQRGRGTLRDPEAPQCVAHGKVHTEWISAALVAPGGSFFTAGWDGTLRQIIGIDEDDEGDW